MPSPQTMRRNGEAPVGTPSSSPRPRLPPPVPLTATPSPHHHHHHHQQQGFYSTVALQKLRRLNFLVLVLRFLAFVCSLTSFVFMLTNSGSQSLRWLDFDAFRFVLSAGAIVALYSLFEMVASVWEITTSSTLFAEFFQVWFDFANDQVLAYVLVSAESAGTELAKALRRTDACSGDAAFCLQSDISVGLGLLAFVFLALSSLFSGFRLVSFLVNGSRFHF